MKRTIVSGVLMAAIVLAWAGYALAQESKRQAGKEPPARQKSLAQRGQASYTCPSHPAMKATWAGQCPYCGQALSSAKKAQPAASAIPTRSWWAPNQAEKTNSNVQYQGCQHWYGRLIPGHRGRCSWLTDDRAGGGCCSCW